MKKLVAMILAFTMLVSLSCTVAADEMSATPTVEEILNEYHQKSFERKMQSDTDIASTRTHYSGTTMTLEQETVDALTAAGYEAYNVTAENYEELEAELKTDFASLGLNANGSYIVVIEGGNGDGSESANGGARTSPETDFQGPDYTGGLPSTHTYNGVTYSVRFVTVTFASDGNLSYQSAYALRNLGFIHESWIELAEYCLTTVIDSLAQYSVASVASLIADMTTDSNLIPMEPGDMIVHAGTTWTRQFIEVYHDQGGYWSPSQCSEYAMSTAYLSGLKQKSTGVYEPVVGSAYSTTTYSPYYYALEARLNDAVNVFLHSNVVAHDDIDVVFYFDSGDLSINSNSRYLFTHYSPVL